MQHIIIMTPMNISLTFTFLIALRIHSSSARNSLTRTLSRRDRDGYVFWFRERVCVQAGII